MQRVPNETTGVSTQADSFVSFRPFPVRPCAEELVPCLDLDRGFLSRNYLGR